MINDYMNEVKSLLDETTQDIEAFISEDNDATPTHNHLKMKIDSSMRELSNNLQAYEQAVQMLTSTEARRSHQTSLTSLQSQVTSLQRRWLTSCPSSTAANLTHLTRLHEAQNSLNHLTDKTERQTRQLEKSKKMANETEQIGENIMYNLYQQRETIQRVQGSSNQISSNLDTSTHTLSRMETYTDRVKRWWSGES
eukprot:GHVN01038945.1.p1 GENE.GHVN01038945.1~~GHVN01038945.1.p1  ORF type:complete len:196 (-),score=63.74 GHVN01038945.1:139-726(-)